MPRKKKDAAAAAPDVDTNTDVQQSAEQPAQTPAKRRRKTATAAEQPAAGTESTRDENTAKPPAKRKATRTKRTTEDAPSQQDLTPAAVEPPATREPETPQAPTRTKRKRRTRNAQGATESVDVTADIPPDQVAEAQAEPAPQPAPVHRRGARRQTTPAGDENTAAGATPADAPARADAAEAAEVSLETGITVRPKTKRGRKSKPPTAPDAPIEQLAEPVNVQRDTDVPFTPAADTAPEPQEAVTGTRRKGGAAKRPAGTKSTARRGRKANEVSQPDQPSTPDLPAPTSATGEDAAAQLQPAVEDSASGDGGETPVTEGTGGIREVLLDVFRRQGRPLHVRDLERQLTKRDRERIGERADLGKILENYVERGELIRTRKRTYGLPEAMNLVRGRFQSSASGFGFVIPEGGGEDYYIAPEETLEAWNGDIVLVRPEGRARRGDSPRATVVRIVQRAHRQLVGSLEYSRGYALLKSDDTRVKHRVLLMPEGAEGVPAGARVLVELFWPERTGEDEVFGRITKVLGETDDPQTETQAVIIKFDLRDEFPPEVLAQAQAIPAAIPAESLEGRLDLRDYHIFTVDGRDAKDFDDAIHIQSTPNGNFVVGVHIADVSHYVQANTPLDKEAYVRATSVYLPGHVLPMLPEHLSNGVCSLVPDEDRLTLSAMIEVNSDGDVQNVELTPSVIRSQARLTYDEVQAYSEGIARLPEHARKVEGDLHLLLKLTSRMRQKRLREGSLDFKLREVKVDVDREGNLQLIPIREETARGMIEDLMLLANKVVARHMLERGAPALYRVHEEPTQGRFGEVSAALARMGVVLGDEATPQAYQAALKKVRGTPQESVVNTLLLRSLKQARYSEENLGHFGLAFEEYLHFTSPIRRYPDLIVHRAMRATLNEEGGGRALDELRSELPRMAEHTSERERSAAEAERDLTKYYQAKWAQAHLGESFSGTVSGVTSFGVFVALENGVEGLLHISNLDDDYYYFLEEALMLKGRSSGRTFRLGDPVDVTIAQVNPLARQIDFSQETDMTDNGAKARARRRGEREQERAAERTARINERPPRLAALDEQQQQRQDGGTRARTDERRGGNRGPGGRGSDRLAPPRAQERGGGGKRRVVTLDRPRNEHNRPVAVTVQRMYFGDWSLDNLREDEPQGGGGNPGYKRPPQGSRGPGRAPQQSAASSQGQSQGQAPAGDGDGRNRRRRRRRGRGNGGKSGGGE